MSRFSLVLMIACVGISVDLVLAQDVKIADSGTVRGKIVDTTKAKNPIEAGRYLINIHKEGSGELLGKSVTVVNGGDHIVPLKMTRQNPIFSLPQKQKNSIELITCHTTRTGIGTALP